jgi:sugar/nucleoside kinase (ribokinase family)
MSGTIIMIGDVLLQLISGQSQESAYQRTLIADAAEAKYGGSPWNIVWNLDQLGWTTRMLAQHGPDAAGCFPQLPISGRNALEPSWCKSTRTDQLLVFPNVAMPAIYLMGRISQDEFDLMFSDADGHEAIIFAGSRHPNVRHRTLDVLFSQPSQLRVFSPSYTVYEYSVEEIAGFLSHADIAIVNRNEAAFLTNIFATDEASVMARARVAGIVTRDEEGAVIYPAGGNVFHIPSTSRVHGDVIGAGDAFLSGFVDGFLRSNNLTAAARVAAEVAAQTARSGLVCAVLDAARAHSAAGL